jgi:nitrogen fixation protein FixH
MIVLTRRRDGDARALQGWHVLVMALTFFGIIFAVNGVMLVQALRTHSGVVAVEPYRKGLAYNDRIADGDRQGRLGWREAIGITREGQVSAAIVDDAGRAVSGLTLTGTLGRPSTSRADLALAFTPTEPGMHIAHAGPLAPGAWIVTTDARAPNGELVYRDRRRLWLTP